MNIAYIDVENICVDMKQLVALLNIVIDDFADNGELEARREMTASALHIIRDHLDFLADMKNEVVGHMAAEVSV